MRLFLAALAILATATPTLAETNKQRAERCAAQAEIVEQAVEMRKKRKSEKKTKEAILDATADNLDPSVPLLVGFVYTLNRKDLKADVKGDFERQCTDYKP